MPEIIPIKAAAPVSRYAQRKANRIYVNKGGIMTNGLVDDVRIALRTLERESVENTATLINSLAEKHLITARRRFLQGLALGGLAGVVLTLGALAAWVLVNCKTCLALI
ncbi:MAG: hypothetical protein OEZ10_08735 [Gammaproteobacteria bacterium]|nr:hypothetical protein [Gammaproteobacteria bacterium]